jgi:16S rRNA (uracil1498-N3)-methyltransferase
VADPGGASPTELAPRVAAAGSTVLVVGPEGGLVDDELALLERHGWHRICLARHVLRAETAAVAGVALLSWLGGLELACP